MISLGSRAVVLALFAAGLAAVGACGTEAVGIDTCRQIEEARCRQAPGCDVDLTQPIHRDSPARDVDACIRYYHDACLHGLAAPADPGAIATKACIRAIDTGNCDIVLHPETAPACAFLIPPAAVDAGVDADAAVVDAADGG